MEMLGLYLSIPFCRSKCTFCNFASGVFPAAHHEPYIARLEDDLRRIRTQAQTWGAVLPEAADSIYFGGGTPSLLAPALFRRLFTALRREFAVLPTAEITVECAPGQLDPAVLETLADCGVNRISFGVQSFVDGEAKSIGRLHTRAVALDDLRRVRAAGISDISIDLIAGLPGQTMHSWFESLGVLAGSGVDHASIYMLEVDDDSRLGREILTHGGRYRAADVPDDDLIADMYTEAIAYLAGHGLAQYEISNFARAGSESRHNLKYWRRQPYLGFGLDAHSMLNTRAGGALRFAATDDLDAYLAGTGAPRARPRGGAGGGLVSGPAPERRGQPGRAAPRFLRGGCAGLPCDGRRSGAGGSGAPLRWRSRRPHRSRPHALERGLRAVLRGAGCRLRRLLRAAGVPQGPLLQ